MLITSTHEALAQQARALWNTGSVVLTGTMGLIACLGASTLSMKALLLLGVGVWVLGEVVHNSTIVADRKVASERANAHNEVQS